MIFFRVEEFDVFDLGLRVEVEVHGEPAQCSPAVICIVYYENAIAATGLN